MGEHELIRKLVGLFSIVLVMQGCSYSVPEPKPYELEGLRKGASVGDIVISSQPTEAMLKHFADQGFRSVITTRGEG